MDAAAAITPWELACQLDGARYVRAAPGRQLIYVWYGQRTIWELDADGAVRRRYRTARGNAIRYINAQCRHGVQPLPTGRSREIP